MHISIYKKLCEFYISLFTIKRLIMPNEFLLNLESQSSSFTSANAQMINIHEKVETVSYIRNGLLPISFSWCES